MASRTTDDSPKMRLITDILTGGKGIKEIPKAAWYEEREGDDGPIFSLFNFVEGRTEWMRFPVPFPYLDDYLPQEG